MSDPTLPRISSASPLTPISDGSFAQTYERSENPEGASSLVQEANRVPNQPAQPESPRRGRVILTKTYFLDGKDQYYYDQDHNVFLEVGQSVRKIHEGWSSLTLDNLLELEYISGLPYYFGLDGNLYYIAQDTMCQVPTQTYYEYGQPFEPAPSATSPNIFQSDMDLSSDFNLHDMSQYPVSNGGYYSNAVVNPDPLRDRLQDRSPTFFLSASSVLSPIPCSATPGPSYKPSEPSTTPNLLLARKEEVKEIQEGPNHSLNRINRLRCRHCNKVFLRLASLEDHLNVHSGTKRKRISCIGIITY
ncbi:C2H2 zinc finger [Ceratobasidium sp. AG-Ba]|nr:C2H2 zinc finger [Ceratobasidium sp. AG-Ba]